MRSILTMKRKSFNMEKLLSIQNHYMNNPSQDMVEELNSTEEELKKDVKDFDSIDSPDGYRRMFKNGKRKFRMRKLKEKLKHY